MDFISFDPRLITENNLHDGNRPYRYEQNIQEQQNLFTNNEDDNNIEEHMFENQNENPNEGIALHINENNASEYHSRIYKFSTNCITNWDINKHLIC